MLLSMMRAKLHRATVTQCDLHYEGSVSIDKDLLDASSLIVNEEVHIWNISNGARIVTYVIEAPAGSKEIGLNGAAARHFAVGDRVIITSFCAVSREEAAAHRPTVVLIGENNEIDDVRR